MLLPLTVKVLLNNTLMELAGLCWIIKYNILIF